MRPCSRVGVNFTWKCNWSCTTCFYRHFPELHKGEHRSKQDVKNEILNGKNRGCDHMVAVGQGEPSLYPDMPEIVQYCTSIGMTSSIITNGASGVDRLDAIYKAGLNHFHVSVHGIGDILNAVSESPTAAAKQNEFKQYLKDNKILWRSNTTLQKINYKALPDIITDIINYEATHIVLLGFLPHYHWINRLQEVAVSPEQLRPFIETCCDLMIQANKYFTIRYHPFCHLNSKYWKYVVNARYVLFDPWEWDYGSHGKSFEAIYQDSIGMGNSVAIQGAPCNQCKMQLHCGGWNRIYAAGFNGANLKPILDVPDEYKNVWQNRGGLHDMNPANNLKGYF